MSIFWHFKKNMDINNCNLNNVVTENFSGLAIGTGGAQPLNGALPSLPSPTMPGFNMAAQTVNGQPPPQEAVYTNGIHQTFTGRKLYWQRVSCHTRSLPFLCIKIFIVCNHNSLATHSNYTSYADSCTLVVVVLTLPIAHLSVCQNYLFKEIKTGVHFFCVVDG